MQNNTLLSPIKDARVLAVIERLIETRRRPSGGSPISNPEMSRDPYEYAEYGFSIYPEQGDLMYLLCRGMRATRVVDFATSIGMSAIYFAAAIHWFGTRSGESRDGQAESGRRWPRRLCRH